MKAKLIYCAIVSVIYGLISRDPFTAASLLFTVYGGVSFGEDAARAYAKRRGWIKDETRA